MEYNLIDAGLVPIIIAIVESIKPRVSERWRPLLPWPFAFMGCSLAVIAQGWLGWPEFLAKTLLETAKVALTAMGLFKIYHTTIKGE